MDRIRFVVITILIAFVVPVASAAKPEQRTDAMEPSLADVAAPPTQQLPPPTVPSEMLEQARRDAAPGQHTSNAPTEKVNQDKRIADATVWLAIVTAALAVFTGALWVVTFLLGRDARRVSERQAVDTQKSLGIAAATTKALEDVAEATRRNTALLQPMLQKQMRAYVSVDLGNASYQDSRLSFGSYPVLTNTGLSPARNVAFGWKSQVLELKAAATMKFPEPELLDNDATLHPRQTFSMTTVLSTRVADADLADIVEGNTRRYFVWGIVRYEDMYGESHETKFCHNWAFYPNAQGELNAHGYYNRTHNSST